MRPIAKVVVIVAGYLLAVLVAVAVVSIYVAATDGPERQASGGMYAFGDAIFFLAVFGLAAIPATSAALFFLREVRRFWPVLSVVALAVAASGPVAVFAYFTHYGQPVAADHSIFQAWATLSPLRIIVAPLFALAFLLSGLFAPARSSRLALLLAAAVEAMIFVSVAFHWFQLVRSH